MVVQHVTQSAVWPRMCRVISESGGDQGQQAAAGGCLFPCQCCRVIAAAALLSPSQLDELLGSIKAAEAYPCVSPPHLPLLSCHCICCSHPRLSQLDELLGSIKAAEAEPRVGHLPKEQPTGPLAEMWLSTLNGSGLTLADAAPGGVTCGVCVCGGACGSGEGTSAYSQVW